MIGYALALFAWVRGERRPDWAKFLPLDAAHTLGRGPSLSHATEDSLFGPETCRSVDRPTSWHAAGTDRRRFALGLLGRIVGIGPAPHNGREDLGQAVSWSAGILSHRLPDVRAEAARALAPLGL